MGEQTQPQRKAEKFRIYARKFYLTYSQVHKDLDFDRVLAFFKDNTLWPLFDYVISRENHQDGRYHFHVLLLFTRKVSITNPRAFDIEYQEHFYHGNYQPARSMERIIEYVCKKGYYITNMPNVIDGRVVSPKQMLVKDVEELGLNQALLKHAQAMPDKALNSLSLLHSHSYFQKLQELQQAQQADQVQTPFELENFYMSDKLKQWADNPDRTLLLVGDSGIGKTQFCKAFIKKKKLKPLLVNHKEDFKRLDPSHDAVLIDDANLVDLKASELLALVDNTSSKTLRVLYKTAFKKQNLVQMIAMNKPEFEQLFATLATDRFARRTHFEHLKEPFINKVTVNIQVNQVNNDNSTNIHFNEQKEQEEQHVKETLQAMREAFQEGKQKTLSQEHGPTSLRSPKARLHRSFKWKPTR